MRRQRGRPARGSRPSEGALGATEALGARPYLGRTDIAGKRLGPIWAEEWDRPNLLDAPPTASGGRDPNSAPEGLRPSALLWEAPLDGTMDQAVLREAVSRTRENGLLGRMARALLPAAMAELDGGYAWHKPVFTERERKGLARPPWYKPD